MFVQVYDSASLIKVAIYTGHVTDEEHDRDWLVEGGARESQLDLLYGHARAELTGGPRRSYAPSQRPPSQQPGSSLPPSDRPPSMHPASVYPAGKRPSWRS